MNYPADLKYTKNDEWIRVEGKAGTVGISDYAQDQLSDIVYVEYRLSKGAAGKKGDIFGIIESVKAASDIYLPASGSITDTNHALIETPEIVNSDPYGKAWMIKLELSNPAELNDLMDASAYEAYVKERSA